MANGGHMCLGSPETVTQVMEALRVVLSEVMERRPTIKRPTMESKETY